VLRQQLVGRRIRYTNAQRRGLGTAAEKLGRKALSKIDTLVTPQTLLRWYRRLVAQKYDGTARRGPNKPRRTAYVVELVLRMARENTGWGYTRIRGALAKLGHDIGRNTIKRILFEAGMDPAPERTLRHQPGESSRRARGYCPPAARSVDAADGTQPDRRGRRLLA
jgi:putative transposase